MTVTSHSTGQTVEECFSDPTAAYRGAVAFTEEYPKKLTRPIGINNSLLVGEMYIDVYCELTVHIDLSAVVRRDI